MMITAIKTCKKIFPIRRCWNLRSKHVTLILMDASETTSVEHARLPYLRMLLYSVGSRNALDDGVTGLIVAMNMHHVARAKACRASAVV